jgi:hypothetical protein
MAKYVWVLEEEEITEVISETQHNDATVWLSVIMQTLPQEQVTRVVVRLRVIWYARRQGIHENKF